MASHRTHLSICSRLLKNTTPTRRSSAGVPLRGWKLEPFDAIDCWCCAVVLAKERPDTPGAPIKGDQMIYAFKSVKDENL
jgi:hypothetical protein